MRPLLLLALAALPARAQAPETASAADAAAADVVPYLEAPAVLAATAALLHADTGRYPAEPFALLGAPVAAQTGARGVRLARLDLAADGDTLRVAYVLTPSADGAGGLHRARAERAGRFALFREGDGYTARLHVDLHDDPDLSDAALPLTTEGPLRVRSARGRLCLDTAHVRALAAEGRVADAAPFLAGEPVALAFVTVRGGRPVARVVLTPGGPGP
jgi:hypothetical protein